MKTLTSDGSGEISSLIPTFPGTAYSLYVRKSSDTPPAAGTLVFYHDTGGVVDPVLGTDGLDVTVDLATVAGLAVSFISHGKNLLINGSALGAAKNLRFSLIPVRS